MIVLAIPPGWTLHPGGAHIALPLLQGYLRLRGIDTRLYDMNIESATHHGATITENSVKAACESFSAVGMNEAYFSVEDGLGDIAKSFGGKWLAHEGYQHLDCDLGDPASVRKYSHCPSPFTEYFREKMIPEILGLNPRIVGLSLYVPSQMLTAFEFVRLLRAAGYEGFVALGGNMISRIAKDMKHEWVFDLIDGLTTYQGERALEELYQSIKVGASLDGIPNLTWRNSDGEIVENKIDLLKPNQFAPPDFAGLRHDEYWGTKYFTMVGARGCFYGKCSFCAIPFGWGPGNYIGISSGSAVVRAMNKAYTQFGVRRFKFIDEALHPRMLREMDAVRSEYAADFIFEGYVRLDPTWSSTEFLQLCRRVGLRKAYLGLELVPSGTRDVLNKADRGDPVLIFQRMKAVGIKTHVFCLFGFPGTGVDEALATTDFALKHSDKIDTLDIFPFYFARHTKVEGIKLVEESARTWRTEHKYEPDAPGVLWPAEVEYLTERMNAIVWRERPQWSHPIYRMYSPWHDSTGPL